MTNAKEKPAASAEPKQKPVKSPAAKASTKPAAAPKKAEPKKESLASGKVKVTQLIGCIGRRYDQEATLIGLGLNKRNRSRVLEDTPSVRGMIYKVRHLLKVEQA